MVGVLLLTGCNSPKAKEKNTYFSITPIEAKEMIDNDNDIIILDVRSKSEYDEGHLKDAVNMEYGLIETEFASNITSDLDSTIIVYCLSGARAKIASEELINLGYKNVYTFGGLNSWEYDIIKGE